MTTRRLAQKQQFLERVRNSSLVKRLRAENTPGLKHITETASGKFTYLGRGAYCCRMKSE